MSAGTASANAESPGQLRNTIELGPIDRAIEALECARECGGQIDIEMYRRARARLSHLREVVQAFDRRTNADSHVPSSEDYHQLIDALGLVRS